MALLERIEFLLQSETLGEFNFVFTFEWRAYPLIVQISRKKRKIEQLFLLAVCADVKNVIAVDGA